jgi:signal transduction histidine kinase/ligand-binding sensor domain-containing protein/DNA-binding response OmpR family regulator
MTALYKILYFCFNHFFGITLRHNGDAENLLLMKKIILFLFVCLSLQSNALNYDSVTLTNNEGLSNSSVNSIYQDSQGLMWFGTWDGLNVYNSKEFNVFKPSLGKSKSISNNIIRDIIEQKNGHLWITTDFGINRYDKQTHNFDRYFVDARNMGVIVEHSFFVAKNSLDIVFASVYGEGIFYFNEKKQDFDQLQIGSGIKAKRMFFDGDDNLWILVESGVLYKIVFKKGPDSYLPLSIIRFRNLDNIESIFPGKKDDIWIQTQGKRLFRYQVASGTTSEISTFPRSAGKINAILVQTDRQLWGTSSGLYSLEEATGEIKTLIPSVPILSLCAGSQHIVWVGTDMLGVWQLSPSREKFNAYLSETINPSSRGAIRAFAEEKDGTLWVGTKGSGIFTYSHKEHPEKMNLMHHFDTGNGLLSNSVYTIVDGLQNEIWIGTDGQGINYYDKVRKRFFELQTEIKPAKKINICSVYSILPDGENVLWVGTSGYGMYKLVINKSTTPYSIQSFQQYIFQKDDPSSLSNNIVYSIIRDDRSHLWIATRGGGLNRFNIETQRFQAFRYINGTKNALSSDDVLSLLKDKLGVLWVGTSLGLNKLTGFSNGHPSFIHFTEKEGISNNTIHGILEDKQNNLWVSTNKGIAKLVKEGHKYRIVTYYKKDGLQDNEFSDGAFYKSSRSGMFYFGGIKGFNVFNPLEIVHSTYTPPLLLDAFYIDNEQCNLIDYQKNNTLGLSYKNKSFSFRFIPLDYLSGSKCEISYMLEGFQKEWIQLGTSNAIVFSNLPPGNYMLKVKCSNADKIWSNEHYSLPITILPPWYGSGTAFVIYAIILIAIIFGAQWLVRYQMTVKNNIKMKELEKQKTEEVHQAKLRFFTNIAHEFSNSLTLIYGPCEQLLRTYSADSLARKYINIIKSNSERMQLLIHQLIEFRKAETGHLKLAIEPVDIHELIRFEADNFLDVFEQKRIKTNFNFSSEKMICHTDRDSLGKIIFNLISNAVKYTPENEIFEITAKQEDDNFILKFTNTGIGIDPAYKESIFDRFEVLNRFESQVSKGQTRSGIGLALCKNLVEVLQGTINVESDGCTFTSFLVCIQSQKVATGENGAPRPNLQQYHPEAIISNAIPLIDPKTNTHDLNLKNILVLIIDDEQEIRQLISDFLCEKYDIVEASNGKEAIEVMRQRMPSIIICDVIMPVMDGVEFVKTIKQQDQTRHIPIILLSSRSSVESQIEGLETGADAYIGKPFHPQHLEAVLESHLRSNKATLDYSESHYSAIDVFEGKVVKKEDKELILTIAEIIYKHLENDNLSLDLIAAQTAMSKMQLYRKIKEILGVTPTEYIRSLRLKQAEKLLRTTNKTVQEIMYACGFNNKAYFYREFSKKNNATPKEYQNKHLK